MFYTGECALLTWWVLVACERFVKRAGSDALHKTAREEAGFPVPLQGPLEPTILALLVHEYNVTILQFQLSLALRRVGHDHSVPFTGYSLGFQLN